MQRSIIIGDIHGCYDELQQLLAKVQFSEQDVLISVGDIVDRGADSVKVYEFLRSLPNCKVLMGNHERKHLRGVLSFGQEIVKLQFGEGYADFVAWLKTVNYYLETEEAIIVHAAVENGVEMANQREDVLAGTTAGEKYLQKLYGEEYWTEHYTGEKPVIFGHHVVGDEAKKYGKNVYGIDTGACHGGYLTALILPTFEIVSVKAAKDYWKEELVKWQVPVMEAKPWKTYKWQKIQEILTEYADFPNPELQTFLQAKKTWVENLHAQSSWIIAQVEAKLQALVNEFGEHDFKKVAQKFSYATLLFNAHKGSLSHETLL
ncbi:MAG: metallophosphoesterase, partial [Bacteroidia bacterium]